MDRGQTRIAACVNGITKAEIKLEGFIFWSFCCKLKKINKKVCSVETATVVVSPRSQVGLVTK